MLKFRQTNSMRARRAAEAQLKALEDKLQLEWAWKPMAAKMNEKQSDLVYWIPPLYRNNIKTAGSRVRRKSLAKRASMTTRGSMTKSRVPYNQLQAAHMYSQLHASQKKKKLARRRHKLATEVSFEDPTDTDSAILDSKGEWQDAKDEDNESGIHDGTTDFNADDMSLRTMPSSQEAEFKPIAGAMKRKYIEHRKIRRSTIKPKVPPKPDFITRSFEAIDKPKPAPTLIRLLEKVSHIHSRPAKPVKPVKPELKKISRRGSESKFSNRKTKRPSVKIYRTPAQRLSGKRAKALEEEEAANQCVIISVDHKVPEATKPPKDTTAPSKAQPEQTPEPTKESSTKPEDAEFRNAQLQMILRLLAQLYEEKVSRQDSEIQNLKTRIQTQDKLMKQMAHVVLELKEEVSKIKLQSSIAPEETISKMPTHILNSKLKEEVSKILGSTKVPLEPVPVIKEKPVPVIKEKPHVLNITVEQH